MSGQWDRAYEAQRDAQVGRGERRCGICNALTAVTGPRDLLKPGVKPSAGNGMCKQCNEVVQGDKS